MKRHENDTLRQPRPALINLSEIKEKALKNIRKAIKASDIYEKQMKTCGKPLKNIRNL